MKVSKKANKKLIFDRCIAVFCTILAMISCIGTVIIVKSDDNHGNTGGINQDMSDDEYKKLTGITARYEGESCYAGTYVNRKSIKVYGKLDDGTKKELQNWEGRLGPVREGDNSFTITYRDFTTELKITGENLNAVVEAVNYNLYTFEPEEVIKLLAELDRGKISYNDVFDGVVFCGDSRTKAIMNCKLLDEDKILAENGVGLDHIENYMQELLKRNPETIILNYGVNSMSESREARDEVVLKYKEIIQDIKAALPQTRIIVAAIFPVSSSFAQQQPRMYYIEDMNLSLFKMCVELDIEFIDGTDIINDNTYLFNPDGLHFDDEFYSQFWLRELVEKLGIGIVDFGQ